MSRFPLAAFLVLVAAAASGSVAGGMPAPAASLMADGGATGQRSQADNDDDDDDKDAGQGRGTLPQKADRGAGGADRSDRAEGDDDEKPAVAKARFPQPVQVGQLIGRDVLAPLESQPVLGHVRNLVRAPDGAVEVIVDQGGWWGWASRPVAVPLAALALLGADVVVVGLTPAQFAALPTATAGQPLPPGETIRVGLTKPAH